VNFGERLAQDITNIEEMTGKEPDVMAMGPFTPRCRLRGYTRLAAKETV
jgi:hypothetical protein